ncbi:MAG: ABC transporter permease [Clostridia bacterium]|nr:ABC transporter permease [Clostridia bacterium]
MKIWTFSKRCTKEILRDPINLFFGLGFPIVLLLLLSAIQANVPVELFAIERLTPGITVFGFSFLTLFSASLIAKDRESAFLQRLYTTPLCAHEFILGYILPMLPLALAQSLCCYLVANMLGLPFTVNIFYALLFHLPMAVFYISLGLLFGSILNSKQVGGICGALLTNLSAWLSGVWFDLSLVGGAFETIAHALPFVHAVELGRAVLNGNFTEISVHVLFVIFYMLAVSAGAVLLFLRQMKKQ